MLWPFSCAAHTHTLIDFSKRFLESEFAKGMDLRSVPLPLKGGWIATSSGAFYGSNPLELPFRCNNEMNSD
jgi:hypothetical protein